MDIADGGPRCGTFDDGFVYLGEDFNGGRPTVAHLPERSEPPRRVLYVTAQGAGIDLRQGQLRVRKRNETLLTVPLGHVGQVVAFGAVGLSAGAREQALRRGIEVCFVSRRGGWLGRLDGPRAVQSGLRRLQYQAAEDDAIRLRLASTLVAGKIANLRALLLRYFRRDGPQTVLDTAEQLGRLRERVLRASSVASCLGIEGTASRQYFQALGALLPPGLDFTGRNRRPPRDPVNSALSFGYSLLVSEATAAVAAAGLDPYVGFLHAESRDRPSLGLDLMEEFRPLIVDTVVIELFRRGMLIPDDFRGDREHGVLLKDVSRKAFLSAYEERLLTIFAHVPSGQRTWYRRALFLQARQITSVIQGHVHQYRPVAWR